MTGILIELWLCERKKLGNGSLHPVWTFAKILCSSVFFDQAEFNLHTQGNHERSQSGTPAEKQYSHSRKSYNHYTQRISGAGVIDKLLKNRQAVATKQKRTINDRTVDAFRVKSEPEQSIFWFISQIWWKYWDKNIMRVYYLTMDNTPIHTPAKVCDLVESRNYKSLYLPPCSPFLNPIENFWGESQGWIRRSALSADDHAVSYFPRCELGVKIS